MSLWVDQYRPRTFDQLHYHMHISDRLKALSACGDFPHTLFYGPSGAGKKTRIRCTLRQLFGTGTDKVKIEQRVFATPSGRKLTANIIRSNYHIELTPSEAGAHDLLIVQELIKEIGQALPIIPNAKQRFKVVLINEAESLSREAQAALRRTMEKYAAGMRIMMCANSTNRLIEPIRSRSLLIRVAAPDADEMLRVLNHVALRVGFDLPIDVARSIIGYSNGNVRKAILVLESLKTRLPDWQGKLVVPRPDWEIRCRTIADMIVAQQTPAQVMAVRTILYELLTRCVQATTILKAVADLLVDRFEEDLKADVIHWAAYYEVRLKTGDKEIVHLEAWVVKVMMLYAGSKLT